MSEEVENKNWSEWLDWLQTDIYDTIYDNVPGSYWGDIDIEFKMKDGSIMKAHMEPYEEYTEDDYWKTYELHDEHYNWPVKTDGVVEWRYLKDWED